MKKGTLIFSMLILFGSFANAQIENPVKWNAGKKKTGFKSYELQLTAIIDSNWHLYAQDAGFDLFSTTFKFATNPIVKFDGVVSESGVLKKVYDPNLRLTLKFYTQQVNFSQKIKIKTDANTLVNGTVNYIVCNDKKCLPPKKLQFSINLDGE